jgi:5-bromo-4-chloroindolyl phosphate hydrolysis protein
MANPTLTNRYKQLRHKIDAARKGLPGRKALLNARNSLRDVGRENHRYEITRKNVWDVFWANSQRAKESVRVLEEFSKLMDIRSTLLFKKIRYDLYEAEKGCAVCLTKEP